MITVTAFRQVPSFAQGFVRDLRVRWALEEAGISYTENLITGKDLATAEYRALQPFGQVPVLEDDGLILFESGAIVLHIAEKSDALMPSDPEGRARTRVWAFAALNSVEPAVQRLGELNQFHATEPWAAQLRPVVEAAVHKRLDALEGWLGDKDFLEDRFSAGDLLMSTVLRVLHNTKIISDRPRLMAYHERCEARPTFGKAMADHMRPFLA